MNRLEIDDEVRKKIEDMAEEVKNELFKYLPDVVESDLDMNQRMAAITWGVGAFLARVVRATKNYPERKDTFIIDYLDEIKEVYKLNTSGDLH